MYIHMRMYAWSIKRNLAKWKYFMEIMIMFTLEYALIWQISGSVLRKIKTVYL